MSHCPFCKRPLIADMDERVIYQPFEGEEESFILHKHCFTEFSTEFEKLKSQKKKAAFVFKLLKKLSDS